MSMRKRRTSSQLRTETINNETTYNEHSMSPTSRRRQQSRISSAKHRERQQNRVVFVEGEIKRLQRSIRELERSILKNQNVMVHVKESESGNVEMPMFSAPKHTLDSVVSTLKERMDLLCKSAERIHLIKEKLKEAVDQIQEQTERRQRTDDQCWESKQPDSLSRFAISFLICSDANISSGLSDVTSTHLG